MKKLFLTLMFAVAAMAGMAQSVGDAFYIYRNDGQFNAFFRAEVDSIVYSNYDADSVYYDEIVTQLVYTQDSVYWIPLASVDSVGFVRPETKYKDDVIRLDKNLIDYIIGADSLTLMLKSNTPAQIIPVIGEKLVLLEGCDVLPYGFSGIVSSVQTGKSSINVVCEQAYLEDLFDSFCSVSTVYGLPPDEENAVRLFPSFGKRRVTYSPDDLVLHFGPYRVNRSYEVSQGIAFNGDLALSGGASFSVEVQPTLKIHTFLILGEGQGTYFSYRISGDLRVTSQSSLYGGLSYNHDFDGLIASCPIPETGNMVNVYINPGLFVRADGILSSSITSIQDYTFGSAFDFSSKGQNTIRPSIGGRLASSSVDMSGSLDGSLAGGAYMEIGFNLLSREIARVCVRGEIGARFGGSFVLRNSDIVSASRETKLYERLKTSTVDLSSFVNVSLQASVAHTGNGLTWELSEPIHTWNLVPEFSELDIKKDEKNLSATIISTPTNDILFPLSLGIGLYDDKGELKERLYQPTLYKRENEGYTIKQQFSSLQRGKEYEVRPMIKFLVGEISATPTRKIKFDKEISVHTLSAYNTQTSSAVVRGRVDDFISGQDDGEVGFFYNKTGTPSSGNAQRAIAGSLSSSTNGEFLSTLSWLEQGTTYYYCAYLYKDGEYKYGEVLSFTTMKAPDPDPVAITGASYNVKTTTATISCTYENVPGGAECGYYLQSQGSGRTFYSVGNLDGSKTINLSNLKPSTTYYYTAAIKNNNREYTGAERSFTTEKEKEPKATTGDYSNVTKNSAIVTCSFENVPDGASCYVFLQWNENGIDKMVTYNASAGVNQRISCTNLKPSTTYYYAAAIKYNNNEYIGAERSFTTEKEKEPKATTGDYSDVTTNSAIVTCSFEDVPDGASCYVFLQWEENGSYNMVTYNASPGINKRISCTNLKPSTIYYYTAAIKYNNKEYTGAERSFKTKDGNTTCPDSNHPHWIDLGLPSGTLWRCCNEGASTPEAYGGYYQFGQVSSAPTLEQIKELVSNCTYQWTTQNGINGRKFTGPNGGSIFLPAAGDCSCWDGELEYVGSLGFYWSSTPDHDKDYPYGLLFGFGNVFDNFVRYRLHGLSVRPVRK